MSANEVLLPLRLLPVQENFLLKFQVGNKHGAQNGSFRGRINSWVARVHSTGVNVLSSASTPSQALCCTSVPALFSPCFPFQGTKHVTWKNVNLNTHVCYWLWLMTVYCPAVRLILFSQGVKLTTEQFNAIFTYYDKVGDVLFKVVINNSWWPTAHHTHKRAPGVQLLFIHCTLTWRVHFARLI